ncbi:MAG: hypothetical protein ACTHMW_05040 [Actinomycetes bacterium]
MTTPAPSDETCTITVLGFPIDVWRQYREHTDELLREFTLIAAAEQLDPAEAAADPSHGVPRRLLDLLGEISTAFGDFSTSQTRAIEDAAARGEQTIDLTYRVSRSIAGPSRDLARLLDEADDYCRAGQHLLTLASPPAVTLLRRWYFEEFAGQAEGADPVSWPAFLAAHPAPQASTR